MKALRHSPQLNSDTYDIHGNPIKGKKANKQVSSTPYSSMNGNFQVHTQGYVAGVGKVDFRIGKGGETLFSNLGNVNSVEEVERAANTIHYHMSRQSS